MDRRANIFDFPKDSKTLCFPFAPPMSTYPNLDVLSNHIDLLTSLQTNTTFQLNSTHEMSNVTTSKNYIFTSEILEYIYMMTAATISMIFSLKFYWITRRGKTKMSPMLRIHQCAWVWFMLTTIFYVLPILLFWNQQGFSEFSLFWLSIRGSLNQASVTVSALSTSFVTFDRILILVIPSSRKMNIPIIGIICLVLAFSTVTVIVFGRSYVWGKETTSCLTFGCTLTARLSDLVALKLSIGILNIILATIFIFVYLRFAKRQTSRREKTRSRFVFFILTNELFFNLIPSIFYISFRYNDIGANLPINLTKLLAPAHCTDGLFTVLIYCRTWSKRIRKTRPQNVITVPLSPMKQTNPTDSSKNDSRT